MGAVCLSLLNIIMESQLVLVYYLIIVYYCEGFKISPKTSFGVEVLAGSDVSESKLNKTRNEELKDTDRKYEARKLEADVFPLVNGRVVGNEIRRSGPVGSGGAGVEVEVKVFTGSQLPERRIEKEAEKKSTRKPVPIVKGSWGHVKPDFSVSVPLESGKLNLNRTYSTDVNKYDYSKIRSDRWFYKNGIRGQKPPSLHEDEGVLNGVPFPDSKRNKNFIFPVDKQERKPDLSDSWIRNSIDQRSWVKEGEYGWTSTTNRWSGSTPNYNNNGYYGPNVRHPTHYGSGWNNVFQRPRAKGEWISCPPFEIPQERGLERQSFYGCPIPSMPYDVGNVNPTPVYSIDDKTLFKELTKVSEKKPEEPKTLSVKFIFGLNNK